MSADTWFTPGRPTHPDFLVIADIVLANDAVGEGGDFESYLADHSPIPTSDLTNIALSEARGLCRWLLSQGLAEVLEVAWTTGFCAGLRAIRETPLPTEAEVAANPDETIFGGVDRASIKYTASQRALRMSTSAEMAEDKVISVATAWIDGVIVGLRFDKRKAAFRC